MLLSPFSKREVDANYNEGDPWEIFFLKLKKLFKEEENIFKQRQI